VLCGTDTYNTRSSTSTIQKPPNLLTSLSIYPPPPTSTSFLRPRVLRSFSKDFLSPFGSPTPHSSLLSHTPPPHTRLFPKPTPSLSSIFPSIVACVKCISLSRRLGDCHSSTLLTAPGLPPTLPLILLRITFPLPTKALNCQPHGQM
jgi:hypothetical protein